MKQIVLIIGAIAVIILIAARVHPILTILAAIATGALFILSPTYEVFKEYERGIVLRLGKFYKIATPGWYIFFSLIDKITRIDMRQQSIYLPEYQLITKENLKITCESTLFYKVKDPKKAVLEVADFKSAVDVTFRSRLGNVFGKTPLEEILEKQSAIEAELTKEIKEDAEKWGIEVIKVELKKITLSPEVIKAFEERRTAEEKKAKMQIEAEALEVYINTVNKAAANLSDKTLAYYYIDSLKNIHLSDSSKIIFPLEFTEIAKKISQGLGNQIPSSQKQEYDIKEIISRLKKEFSSASA